MSLFFPNTLSLWNTFDPFSLSWNPVRYAQNPETGDMYYQENDTNYTVKIFLPDVSSKDFKVTPQKDELLIEYLDLKRIHHGSRVYESREQKKHTLRLPEGTDTKGITSNLEDEYLTITIPKTSKFIESQKKESEELVTLPAKDPNTLLRVKVPYGDDDNLKVKIEDDQLKVSYCSSGSKETENRGIKRTVQYSNRMQRRVQLPKGVTSEQVDAKIENGELCVKLLPERMSIGAKGQENPQLENNPRSQQVPIS